MGRSGPGARQGLKRGEGHALPMTRIFLAEDNDDLAALISRRLQARPTWSVVRARTAKEAASRLEGDRFDVAVLDYLLPDGTGLDLLRVVRSASPQTPVLFLTAHGSEEVALAALGMGATDYMQKTSELFEDLPDRIATLLGRSDDVGIAARVVPVATAHARVEAAGVSASHAEAVLDEVVRDDVLGGAIFDGAGHVIAARLPDGMDPTRVGAAAFDLHAHVGVVGRLADVTPRGYVFLLELEGAVLGVTTVSGKCILAVLVDDARRTSASVKLAELARRLK